MQKDYQKRTRKKWKKHKRLYALKHSKFFNALEKPTQTLDDIDRNFERNSGCKQKNH